MNEGSGGSRQRHAARRGQAAVRRPGMLALAAALLLAGVVAPAWSSGPVTGPAAVPAAEPAARPATEADCTDLLRQFDVAWPSHRDAAKAAMAREARDRGASACRERQYADGVHQLRRALRDIGVKPAKLIRKPEK